MDHSLKISGPSTQEWELVKHCLWISFLFPFWISSWIILRAALLAFGCVSGKAQAQKDVTFNNRLYPDTHHPDFPFLLLAHRLPALLAPPPYFFQHWSFLPAVVSPCSVAHQCAQKGLEQARDNGVPPSNATFVQWLSRSMGSTQRGMIAQQQV